MNSFKRSAITQAAIEALEPRRYLTGVVPLLAQSTTYILQESPEAVVVADVNGDGKQDLITVNANGTIGVFLGNGDGTFHYSNSIPDGLGSGGNPELAVAHLNNSQPNVADLIVVNGTTHFSVLVGCGDGNFNPPQLTTTSGDPSAVAVGDFNNDGAQDVAFGYTSGNVAVRLGAGDGSLGGTPVQVVNAGSSMPITSINVADFNNDGIPDLAVGGDNGDLMELLGNGDGSFQAPTVIQTSLALPFSAAVGDFNGNGDADLVDAQSNGTVDVLLGLGNGAFTAPLAISVPAGSLSVAVADINGDGKPDLAIANAGQHSLTIALGKGDGTFRSALRSYSTPNDPAAIAIGDFTGDGKPSIALADYSYDGLTVFPNVSPGLFFKSAYSLPIGQTSQAVTTADLTGDGHTDLVSVSRDQNTVSISLGNGDGTFREPEIYSVAPEPSSVVVSDLGNGHPDIVVFSTDDGIYNFTVLMGNGDGTFQQPMEFTAPIGSFGPNAIAVGDLNGDGIPDLVVAGGPRDAYINVLMGNGNGTFAPPITYETLGTNPQGVAIGDLGNGFNDIVVTDLDDGTPHGDVEAFMNNGNGTFRQPTTQYPVGNLPYAIALADLTGDGNLDIVVPNAQSNNVSVLLGNGDGTFGATQTFPVGNFPSSVAVADFKNDGHPDLVVSDRFQNAESVLTGNGDGTFAPAVMFPVGVDPVAVAVGDLNGDGRPDIVAANGSDDNLSILLDGSSNLAFSPQPPISLPNAPTAVVAGELINNGPVDLVEVNRESKTLEVFLANGDGSFKTPEIYSVSNYPTFVTLADVNGDGIPDIVVASGQEGTINVFLGNGNGTFKPQIVTNLEQGFDDGPNSVAVADLTGNGKADLVVAEENDFAVLMGNGNGTFGAPIIYNPTQGDSGTTTVYGVAAADVNGDGIPDIVVSAEYAMFEDPRGEVEVFLNQGNGTFAQPSSYYAVGNEPIGVAVADLNGNNIQDIVTSNEQDGTVSVLMGNQDGTFNPAQTFKAGPYPFAIAVADLDGDGKPDIAVTNYGNGDTPDDTVSVLLANNTPGEAPFDAPLTFGVGMGPSSIAVADLNGDGGADIVTANNHGYSLSVLLNATARSPAIVSDNNVTFEAGTYGSIDVKAVGIPTATLTESGALPPGVTFHDNGNDTAGLFGTPTAAAGGVYVLTLTAANGVLAPGTQVFTFSVLQAPIFTSPGNTTFELGVTGAFTIDVSGTPDPTLMEIGNLPAGVTFQDNGNGTATLSGTPEAPVGGNYVLTLTADNASGSANQTFTLTLDQPPSIVSGPGAGFITGSPNSFMVGSTGFPVAALTEAGALPSGVSFVDNGNGTATLSGTPAAGTGGDYVLTITANNGVTPAATQTFNLLVGQLPSFTSAANTTFSTGNAGSFTITTSAFPTASLSEIGALPSGVTFVDNGNGTATLAGTPAAQTGGIFAITLQAANGTAIPVSQSFTLTVDQTPAFNGPTNMTFVAGTAGSVMVGTSGFPTPSLGKKGHLPTGVTFQDNGNGTATIAGDAAALTGGVYLLTLVASNGVTTAATELFTLTIDQAPVFTSSSTASFATSASGTFAITTMGPPTSSLTESGTLPTGLTYTDNGDGTATIAGTAAAGTDGTYALTLTASNGIAPIATQALSVIVQTATITMGGNGTVTAMGTNANGTAAVSFSNGMVTLNIDGQSQTFMASNVSTVTIGLGSGNDSVGVGSNVPLALMVIGGGGNDTIMVNNSMPDSVNGGGGNNSIVAGNGADLLRGGTGNNTVVGGGPGTLIVGGPGDNVLDPMTPTQTVHGGTGNDTIASNGGDSLHGGPGDNIFLNGTGSGDTINGGSGSDFVQYNPNDAFENVYEIFDPPAPPPTAPLQTAAKLVANVLPLGRTSVTASIVGTHLKVFGSSSNDSISVSSDGTNLTVISDSTTVGTFPLSGLKGIRIDGGTGNETITVESSVLLPATILGGGGDDSLTGGGGNNVLIGGTGDDTLVGGAGTNLLVPGARLAFSGQSTGNASLAGGSGYTIADFSRRTDPLFLSNDGLPDSGDPALGEQITLAKNISAIWGGTGDDTIVGSAGGEFLSGGAGSNSVQGGGMGDVLIGGLGRDTVAVAAEPVSLFLANGKMDDYSGVHDPAIDILKLDSKDVLTS